MCERHQKLRALILHNSTPEHERSAALERLIGLAYQGAQEKLTRSSQIGPRRQRRDIDEFARLEPYIEGMSVGETIASIYKVCKTCEAQPIAVDLGYHENDEAVVSVTFSTDRLPNAIVFQKELKIYWPRARVAPTGSNKNDQKTFLLLLGSNIDEGNGFGSN